MAGEKLVKKALDFLRANPELKPYKGGSFSLERQGVYNPKYFDLKRDDLVDEAGNIIASKDVTIPREGFSYDLPAQADPGKIFRGMSAEEFANFQKNNYLQSLGTHNIGEGQKGLTYFSINPDEARSYAHSFAPSEFKPDPARPAYVVAAKRPPDESIARVPGTGESEVGVIGQIPRENVTNVYRGNVVDYIEGIHEPGARVSPSSSVHWEEIHDYARGGHIDVALHAVRHHLAGGGFLSDLFSGPDYLSTGEVASFANMPTQDETTADFFKADRALRLAREAQARADDVTGSVPAPRPQTRSMPTTIAAPAPAPAPEPLFIPYQEPEQLMVMPELPKPPAPMPLSNFQTIPGALTPLSSDFVRTEAPAPNAFVNRAVSLAQDIERPPVEPLAYTAAPTPAPASQAITEAMPAGGKFTNRIPDEPHGTALTKQQADYVIRTIAAETSGKSPEETQAIASVILNRINSGKYGSSPEAVLFAKRQFEPWMKPAGKNYPMKISPESQRYSDARDALEAAMAGEDITRGATNFWAPAAQEALGRPAPSWGRTGGVDIGATRFHKLERDAGGEVEGYDKGGVIKKALGVLAGSAPSRVVTDPAERAANLKKFHAASPEEVVNSKWYHGTAREVPNFTNDKPTFVTTDPKFANRFAEYKTTNHVWDEAAQKWVPTETPDFAPNVMPLHVRAENPWDHTNPDHVQAVLDRLYEYRPLETNSDRMRLMHGDWENIELPYIQKEIKDLGHDAFFVNEGGQRNLAVYNPANQLKSATGNAGTFDPDVPRLNEARGGSVDDALRVVREHHANGEAVGPTAQQRLRETIASIDPERSREQPVMDPATMGEAWSRARQNYQNFPVQEGEAVARPLELGARDVIGGAIAGGAREPGAQFRRGLADLAFGSTGLPESGTLGIGVADLPMATGIPLTLADMARDVGQGDYVSTAMGAAIPAAFYARGPLGAAGRRAVEIAKEYAKPAAAAATGIAGATVAPDEAEAANVLKALKVARVAVPEVAPRKMTLQEVRRTFDPHAGVGMSDEDLARLVNAYGKVASPASLDPELARKGEEIAQGYITKGGSEYGGRSFFRQKPTVPLEELGRATASIPVSHELQPIVNKSWQEVSRERQGSPLLTLGGDLSDWNRILGYGPQDSLHALARPTDIHAGFDYMREPNRFTVWANNPEHAAILNRQVQQQKDIMRAVKKDLPVMATAAPMGPQSIDSSKNMMDLALSAIEGRGIHPEHLREASDYLRSGEFGKTPKAKAAYKQAMADFPGFTDPEAAREFLLNNPNVPGTTRGDIIKGLEQKGWVNKGFPEIGQLRYAASSPQFAMAPGNVMGGRMIEIDPALFGRAMQDKMFSHLTYPGDTFGKYYADVPLVHRQYGAPDVMDMLMAKYNQWRPGAKKSDPLKPPMTVHPFSLDQTGRDTTRKMFEEQRMVQPINERMMESIQRGEQRRPMYGFNEGGSVEDHALMLVSQQA